MTLHHADRVALLAAEHGRRVYQTAYRILGHAQDAEDALQEVFMKLLKASPASLDAVREWPAFIKVMATRTALDALRKRVRRPLDSGLDGDKVLSLAAPSEQNPDARLAERQKADSLRRALHSLPEREAQVFALRYFENLSYEEIAAQMNLSVNLVGVILSRSREQLRLWLAPRLDEASPPQNPNPARKENLHV